MAFVIHTNLNTLENAKSWLQNLLIYVHECKEYNTFAGNSNVHNMSIKEYVLQESVGPKSAKLICKQDSHLLRTIIL